MPIRVKKWGTADGRDFEDRKAATRHERWLELKAVCGDLLEGCGAGDSEPGRQALALSMAEHSHDLRRILRANPVEGGGEGDGEADA